jgi:cytosine deaminase
MRLADYGIAEGFPADLVALDAAAPSEAVARIAQPLWGMKKGRLSFRRPLPELLRPPVA